MNHMDNTIDGCRDDLIDSFGQAPVVIGHRGAAGLLPENTLPGFRRAVELGVQAVELDVHLAGRELGDRELVVIHDPTLERTTNGSGEVAQTDFSTLRELDAGGGAQIPTLGEVLAVLPEQVGLNIELKGAGTAAVLAEWLPAPGARSILISSFDHEALHRFRSLREDYPVAPLFGRWKSDALRIAADFGSGYINLGRKVADNRRLDAINAAGLRALIYTVNDLNEAERLLSAGAWGLFTDYPDRISREQFVREPSDREDSDNAG